ncbi:unnamed protein product, partial [Heterosigma akashiwo]
NWSDWREAVAEEYNSLIIEHDVWELVDPPANTNIVGCRWILAKKFNVDGSLSKYKARLCAQVSMYGLKQARKCWYENLHNFLTSQGYRRNSYESCIYTKVSANGLRTHLSVFFYVDDLVIASSDTIELQRIKRELAIKYRVSDLGELNSILGLKIDRNIMKRTITISQSNFVHEACRKFGLRSFLPVSYPSDSRIDVGNSNNISAELSFTVHSLARGFNNPTKNHLLAAEHALKYAWWTKDLSLTLGGKIQLQAFTDSDFCSERQKGRSRAGYVVFLGEGPVLWASRQQHCVALNTSEAEYVSLRYCTTDVMWLKRMLADMGYPQDPVIIYEDNKGCFHWANSESVHKAARHIHVSFHFVKEMVADQEVIVKLLSTTDQVADLFFTKSLTGKKFLEFRSCL